MTPPPSAGAVNGGAVNGNGTSPHLTNHSHHSIRSTKSNHNHNHVERVALNDVVGSGRVALNDVGGGGGHPHSPGDQRMRFASYASGASTPNTSSGNLSWDGSSQELQLVGEGTVTNDKLVSSRHPHKLSHSGSAIGLDELRTDGAGLSSKVVHIEVPFGKPIEEVYDGVHDGPVLGSGVSGLVRLTKHIATGVKYAVKCLDLGLVGTKAGLEQLREEIFIMCQLDHPNIVRLEEVYESHSEIYLVQELCLGGELFDRLDEQPDYHYTESECARLVKQMLSAVRYLHSKGIIHRDLKLENFLFSSTATDSELKMIDFGLSKHFRFGEVHHEAVGTPYSVAPEVIRGSYDERCDIWAIGVITFLLLSGDAPFGGCGGPEPLLTVRSNILRGDYQFEPEDVWSLVSDKAKEFIKSMLVIDPKHRPTARDAQKHAWLREWASRLRKHDDNMLSPNVVKALVTFKEFSDMRKLLCEVLSFTLLPDQIKDLRKEFEKMDTDGSGEISLAALKQVLMINAGAGSLGALTEEEVEDIFNAMRVKKTETRIHWHEFIAAGLSQCRVDDRNLRLAFDRLDSDHKGVSYGVMTTCCGDHLIYLSATNYLTSFYQYITLDDIMDLVGQDDLHNEDMMRTMWKDSMKSVNCTQAHITYDNFLLLMKGQTKEPDTPAPRIKKVDDLPEINEESSNADDPSLANQSFSSLLLGDGLPLMQRTSDDEISMHSLPNIGAVDFNSSSNSGILASSGFYSEGSPSGRKMIADIVTTDEANLSGLSAELPILEVAGRPRSSSMPVESEADKEEPQSKGDSGRAVNLPEHEQQTDDDYHKSQSALIVNRQLYRAHRQMRISVMEASSRFEEQQARRARDTLIAQTIVQAGLVMRHGHKVQVTSEAIRALLEENKAEQQVLVEKANKRGGRGRSSRKKTISDMSGMLISSMGQDELGDIALLAASKTPDPTKSTFHASMDGKSLDMPSLTEGVPTTPRAPLVPRITSPAGIPVPVVEDQGLRAATVPGEFRKTHDPFSLDGMYGGARMNAANMSQIRSDKKPVILKT